MAEEAISTLIRCENLIKIYKTEDTEVMALQGLDLKVEKGEMLAVVGKSGSGKSTFLNMLGGLDRPSAGSLYVDGKNLFKMNEQELVTYKKETLGFVWQNNARNLLPYLSARENIELPMFLRNSRSKKEHSMEILEMIGMSHKRNSRLDQMSGGEQQRIAIGVALANNPKILLADEPTGSVDVRTANFILDVFRELNNTMGLTILIVTHDRMLASKVRRVVSIQDGKISSEKLAKVDYEEYMKNIGSLEEVQEEFLILDKAGRLQLPREILQKMGVSDNKVKMEMKEGKVILSAKGEM